MSEISNENQNLIVSLAGLLTIDVVLLAALFAQVEPYPPGTLGPFIGAMVTMGVVSVVLVSWDRGIGQVSATIFGGMNVLAVGPQKLVFDPNGRAVVPIIVVGTFLIVVLFYSVLLIRKGGVTSSSKIERSTS